VTKSGLDQWRRKLGRPGKEERAMGSPPLESSNNKYFFVEERRIRTAGLAGIVCGATIRPSTPRGGRQVLRSRNLNREVWESLPLYGGEDVNHCPLPLVMSHKSYTNSLKYSNRFKSTKAR